mmetsp:Transcript_147323/g.410394  ORF Transcript_147323/g.410394 Transcript_147323/m.410394 type:complete len:329 (-) Transcript_147323:204-1190(-)
MPHDIPWDLLLDDGALLVVKDLVRVLQVANASPSVRIRRAVHEINRSLNLRTHRAGELGTSPGVFKISGGCKLHLARTGLPKLVPDATSIGQDDESVGFELLCQQGSTTVFVNNCFYAHKDTCGDSGKARAHLGNWHATTTTCDGQWPCWSLCLQHCSNRINLQNLQWRRRGHDTPPVLAVGLHGPSQRLCQCMRFLVAIDWPDVLLRIVKGRICRVNHDLRQDRNRRYPDARHGLAEDVPDLPLRFCAKHVERCRCPLERQLADLRPIPVSQYDLVVLHELLDHRGGVIPSGLELVFYGQSLAAPNQGIATNGHHNPQPLLRIWWCV